MAFAGLQREGGLFDSASRSRSLAVNTPSLPQVTGQCALPSPSNFSRLQFRQQQFRAVGRRTTRPKRRDEEQEKKAGELGHATRSVWRTTWSKRDLRARHARFHHPQGVSALRDLGLEEASPSLLVALPARDFCGAHGHALCERRSRCHGACREE